MRDSVMDRRRSMASRPYYKAKKEQDYTGLVVISFTVGLLLGATIALGWAGI